MDLGCGKGFDCRLASKRVGPKGNVVGVDMTKEMIDKAVEVTNKEKYPNVEYELSRIEDLENLDEALKKLNKDWNGQRDKLYEKKLKEIEEAHNKWLAENNERNMIRQEEEAARNEEAVRSMRLDADE